MVNGNAVMVTCNSRDEAFDVYEREVAVLAKRIDQSTKRSKP